ncbi:MAG: ATP-binding protein, partial [Chloroflexi bacterium]|nr:ATP-binding protein [Chloroflexota bacterium]
MLTISQLCSLRSVVFDPQKRDTVLDLSDLISGRIDPDVFFEENYITEGMRGLLEHAFRRLEGKSEQGVFLLKQAMGGGKTHNLLSLGLLAQHPEYRERVMGGFHHPDPDLGPVQVIAFSGRETDAPYGIWGALAEQLGQKELFRELYSPLRAPGQKAWENLFRGQRVLILLDELPPYFQSAKSVQVGNSDLAQVTATALSNLLVAIGRPGCERVALVITDLAATYREGSAQIAEVLHDLENETGRTAMSLEPVRLNSDELYHILRTRLFEKVPPEEKIGEVAQAYAEAIRKAKQMDMTSESPEEFAARVMASYPFHPGIRDLYARFRENPGFQQTRGLIRLMRLVAANLWATGKAKDKLLIGVHDVDLNQQQIRAEVGQISSSLG